MAPKGRACDPSVMLKLVFLVPRWAYLSIERFLSAQEAQAAAMASIAADLAAAAEGEEEDGAEPVEGSTWYDAAGEPLMTPDDNFGVSEDPDEDELVFIQRIPRAKKPS